jgi:prevent-host-death family protein
MSEQVNIHEAKTHFSRLVERAAAGEEIVIARAGEPRARLVPLERPSGRRRGYGSMRGKIWLAGDWDSDETNETIALMYFGEGEAEDPAAAGIDSGPSGT